MSDVECFFRSQLHYPKGATTFSTMALRPMTFSTMTLSITTLGVGIKCRIMLSVTFFYCSTECRAAECRGAIPSCKFYRKKSFIGHVPAPLSCGRAGSSSSAWPLSGNQDNKCLVESCQIWLDNNM